MGVAAEPAEAFSKAALSWPSVEGNEGSRIPSSENCDVSSNKTWNENIVNQS